MFTGTLAASKTLNHNLFYWLFKNTAKQNAPLVLWLNGGPGSSSMFGLFSENGPIRVARNGTTNNDFIVSLPRDGQGSWVDEADVVFLDQPVQVGFSYGDSFATTMQQISDEMVTFLVNFIYTAYPEYQGRDFLITGESYAGKYLPQLATSIHKWNLNQAATGGKQTINLKAALIGDPFVSPVRQRMTTHLIAQDTGLADPIHMR
jgi:vitellogenic carboxypeptidase-like protein